jgi:hypothetical protein
VPPAATSRPAPAHASPVAARADASRTAASATGRQTHAAERAPAAAGDVEARDADRREAAADHAEDGAQDGLERGPDERGVVRQQGVVGDGDGVVTGQGIQRAVGVAQGVGVGGGAIAQRVIIAARVVVYAPEFTTDTRIAVLVADAIAAHTKFITDHPTDALAGQSVEALFSLAATFQQHGAFERVPRKDDRTTFVSKDDLGAEARGFVSSSYTKGLSFMELAERINTISTNEDFCATGKAGTVYLCHPFLVHAAQNHYGTTPKFMAQPPLLIKNDFNINKMESQSCPVEKAILYGLRN